MPSEPFRPELPKETTIDRRMKQFSLPKRHKLCALKAIDALFSRESGAKGALSYPLRIVWKENNVSQKGEPVQFFISIPKKRIRKAVDRVMMRRRVREAYRLNRGEFISPGFTTVVDVAFIYVADEPVCYDRVEQSMRRLLKKAFPKKSSVAIATVGQEAPLSDVSPC